MTNTNERPAEEGGEWTDEKIAALCEEAAKGEWSASSLQWKIDDIISRTRKEAEAETWKAAVEAVPKQVADGSEDMDDAWRMAGLNEARAKLITAAKNSGVNIDVCEK